MYLFKFFCFLKLLNLYEKQSFRLSTFHLGYVIFLTATKLIEMIFVHKKDLEYSNDFN